MDRRNQKRLPKYGCFICEGQHFIKVCPVQINTARAAANRFEYFKKNKQEPYVIHIVVSELCHQIDTTSVTQTPPAMTLRYSGPFWEECSHPSLQ